VCRKYKLVSDSIKKGCICINANHAKSIGIHNKKITYIRFGIRCCEVKTSFYEELEESKILLSQDIIDYLGIPLFPDYEIVLKNNEIIIGPFIGILSERTEGGLRLNVNNLKSYLYNYGKINGAILAFSSEGINQFSQLIRGYVYNPETESWEEGTYFYPASIFKRVGLVKELRNHFRSLLGDAVFNNYVFSKWQAHAWLMQFSSLKEHLPTTVLYKSGKDIENFLEDNKSVFIKPIYGSQGTGIVKVDKNSETFLLSYSDGDGYKELPFVNIGEMVLFLERLIKKGKYILQSSLQLITTKDRKIDFRLIVLKDKWNRWQDVGMIARYGVRGSITSNISTGGSAEAAETTLKNLLQLTDEDAVKLRKRMGAIGLDAARRLEECGINCGNLGIDLGIDENMGIWIIEVNNIDPNHTIAIDAKDRQMFYRARLLNMLYAKRLSGF
jgi:glutathione synthase/RimK-type ligase-like ATP-grasp enzyme